MGRTVNVYKYDKNTMATGKTTNFYKKNVLTHFGLPNFRFAMIAKMLVAKKVICYKRRNCKRHLKKNRAL